MSGWSKEQQLFAWSMVLLVVLFVVPSNKALLLVSFIFTVGLSFILKKFTLAILYAYILMLPFQNGKGMDFLVVPAELVYGNTPFIMTVNITVSGLLSIVLLYMHIRDRIFSKQISSSTQINTSDILLGIFIVATIVASIMSNIPLLSFLLALQICGYIFVYYYIQHHRLHLWVIKILPTLLSSLSIFEGVWSILQYVNKGSFGYLSPSPADNLTHVAMEDVSFVRMQGTFGHPNNLGFFMACITPFLFYYSVSKHTSVFTKIISSVGFISGVTALLLSGSRASWIFFALAMVLILRIPIIRASQAVIPFVKRLYLSYVIFCAILIPFIVIPRLSQLAVTFNVGGGAEFRWDLINKSFQITAHNPLGVGLGIFPQIVFYQIKGFTSAPTQPHNLIAQIMVASGYIGAISFFGFLYLKIKMYFLPITPRVKYLQLMHYIGMISLGVFLALSMFYPILTEQQLFAWLWILLSIVA